MTDAKLHNTAFKVKSASMLLKGLSITLICLVALTAIAYVISVFYDRYSSFTVSLDRYDMVDQGLTLSETPTFETPIARLNAKSIKEITNISYDQIEQNVDSINGSHNGSEYIAYTFYCKNMGKSTITYKYGVYLSNVTKNIDEALYITLYVDGVPTTYAKIKKDGSGPEEYDAGKKTVPFEKLATVVENNITDFKPGDVTKYTIVIWLNGNDPECVDYPAEASIVGGRVKVDMVCEIIEAS